MKSCSFYRVAASISMLLVLFSVSPVYADENPAPFSETSLASIEGEHKGTAFVLMLWSIHCAPCFSELQMLGKVLNKQHDLPLVLISTDPPALQEEVRMRLEDYGLDQFYSMQFADNFSEKLRYRIDPLWYGELPRSYFYNAAGARTAHSGTVSQEQLMFWLVEQEAQ